MGVVTPAARYPAAPKPSAEQIEVHVLLFLFFLDLLLLLLRFFRGLRGTAAAAAAAEALELLLARRDDFMNRLSLHLRDEAVRDVLLKLGLDGPEDLLDVRGGRALVAGQSRHEVGGCVLQAHDDGGPRVKVTATK